MANAQITGLTEMQAALSRLPDKIVVNILRASLRQAAKVVADQAKQNFGQGDGPNSISGALRASIRVSPRRGSPTRVAVDVVAGVLTGAQTKKFGAQSAFYALMVEKGHISRGKGEALRGGGKQAQRAAHKGGVVPPHPFMRPAIEKRGQDVLQQLIDTIKTKLPSQI